MIIDIEKARRQLDLANSENDDRVQLALDGAIAVVFDHWKKAIDDYTDQASGALDVPDSIGTAIMLCVDSLFYEPYASPLTPAVVAIMTPNRDPALA